jgi:hypothetical protein
MDAMVSLIRFPLLLCRFPSRLSAIAKRPMAPGIAAQSGLRLASPQKKGLSWGSAEYRRALLAHIHRAYQLAVGERSRSSTHGAVPFSFLGQLAFRKLKSRPKAAVS